MGKAIARKKAIQTLLRNPVSDPLENAIAQFQETGFLIKIGRLKSNFVEKPGF
ncbi:hypothetical protein [Planktothrix sp. FACHB-1365]|uniref:hypothetical protein n=1 Tax=Planktothrix sp. FACHB-1365 TaxID=2692855 RepID=UPI00168979B2|nr:hypothetical protein [Planktothrix sp. FACHB-1365]MBD2484664.1 hypothetical protein [Planktothrix sp. FACHB-1365]